MLKEYIGPGAAGEEGERVNRIVEEVFKDYDVYVITPDIDGDKTYFRIIDRKTGVEANLQGWDLDDLFEDSKLEIADYAEETLGAILGGGKVDLEGEAKKLALLKTVRELMKDACWRFVVGRNDK